MTDVFTDWQPGQPKLKGVLLAGTLRYLRARIDRMQAQGIQAEGVVGTVQSDDRRSFHFVTDAGRQLEEIDLVPPPFRERPEGYLTGVAYDEFDYFYDDATRSSYVVRVDHVGTNIADALAGQFIGYLARGGADAEVFRGIYDAGATYTKGDIVQYGANSTDSALYKAYTDIPAGVTPGTDFRWATVSVTQARDVTHTFNGAFRGSQVIMFRKLARPAIIFPSFQGSVYGQNVGVANVTQKFIIAVSGSGAPGRLGTMVVPAGSTDAQFTKEVAGFTYLQPGHVMTVQADPSFHAVDQFYTSDAIMRSFTIMGG